MRNPEVSERIAQYDQAWQREIVKELRELIHKADPDVNEAIKWSNPAFDDHGPVVWIFCATDWVHFAFIQGALLDNSHGLFEEGKDTPSKAKRTIKFRKGDKVPRDIIVKLVKQAVANNRAGKKIKFDPAPKQKIVLPDDIRAELKAHNLEDEYWSRAYYQQKGYIQWIDQAKQASTRTKRINKMIEELQDGTYMPPKRQN